MKSTASAWQRTPELPGFATRTNQAGSGAKYYKHESTQSHHDSGERRGHKMDKGKHEKRSDVTWQFMRRNQIKPASITSLESSTPKTISAIRWPYSYQRSKTIYGTFFLPAWRYSPDFQPVAYGRPGPSVFRSAARILEAAQTLTELAHPRARKALL